MGETEGERMGWARGEAGMSIMRASRLQLSDKNRKSSDFTKTARRLADVLEGRQELIEKIAERDQGNASDELWYHITVRRRRRSMSLGGTSSQLVELKGQMKDLLKIWKIVEAQEMERKSCGRSWPSECMDEFRKGWWWSRQFWAQFHDQQ